MPKNQITSSTFLVSFLLLFTTFLSLGVPSNSDPLPQPFDTIVDYNITSNCLAFIKNFVNDKDFQSCQSFGFLLESSNGFAVMSRDVANVPPLLDQICTVQNSDKCNKLMSGYASDMMQEQNCRGDLQNQGLIATEAYVSFTMYDVMQTVGCIKNSSNVYCYVDALVQKLGLGLFYLPEGQPLNSPQQQLPCSECNQKIMNLYANYAGDQATPLYTTFPPVRTYFNSFCGDSFVQEPSALPIKSNAVTNGSGSWKSDRFGWCVVYVIIWGLLLLESIGRMSV